MRKLFLIAAVFTLAACASPKDRIADGLAGYGIAEGLAARERTGSRDAGIAEYLRVIATENRAAQGR